MLLRLCAAIAVLLAAGCYPSNPRDCGENGDCFAGEECVERTCRPLAAATETDGIDVGDPDLGDADRADADPGPMCDEGMLSCGGACTTCPDEPAAESFECAGAACVIATCEDDFSRCADGCCPPELTPDSDLLERWDLDVWSNSHLDVAVDSEGVPHVAFYDPDSRTLKHTYWDQLGWKGSEFTDLEARSGPLALGLRPDDEPLIAFCRDTDPDVVDTVYGVGLLPRSSGAWQLQETVSIFDPDFCPRRVALGATSDGFALTFREPDTVSLVRDVAAPVPDVVFNDPETAAGAPVVSIDGALHVIYADFGTVYHGVRSAGFSEDIISTDGAYGAQLVGDSEGGLHFAYRNVLGEIAHRTWSAGEWEADVRIATRDGEPELRDLAVDPWNRPHLLVHDANREVLRYGFLDGDEWRWADVTESGIDSGGRLAVDRWGRKHIAYFGLQVSGDSVALYYRGLP